jgi:hypothetical protein
MQVFETQTSKSTILRDSFIFYLGKKNTYPRGKLTTGLKNLFKNLRVRRISGLFWPLFDSNAQKNPKIGRTLDFEQVLTTISEKIFLCKFRI